MKRALAIGNLVAWPVVVLLFVVGIRTCNQVEAASTRLHGASHSLVRGDIVTHTDPGGEAVHYRIAIFQDDDAEFSGSFAVVPGELPEGRRWHLDAVQELHPDLPIGRHRFVIDYDEDNHVWRDEAWLHSEQPIEGPVTLWYQQESPRAELSVRLERVTLTEAESDSAYLTLVLSFLFGSLLAFFTLFGTVWFTTD